MEYNETPYFIVKNNLQKSLSTGVYFSDVVTPDVLKDVCYRLTGQTQFEYRYVDNDYEDEFLPRSYNKGRMAIMRYLDYVFYISFSELEVGGRNSSVQSVPTAYNMFYVNPYPNKRLCYYFLNATGNIETDYQILIYRLMKTIGFEFLNEDDSLSIRINPFTSIEDIIFNRRNNAGRNRSNNSSFVNRKSQDEIEIYGKTYGANKYETSLICYALSVLCEGDQRVKLYEVLEGDLKELPASSLNVIEDMGNIDVIPTDITMEKRLFERNNSLRSPRYLYNLFNKLGNKHCALCDCEIPELIQGAHIWPVSQIKKENQLSLDEKLKASTDGENGIWLCENHHKMFDEHLFTFDENGRVLFKNGLDQRYYDFMEESTLYTNLPEFIMTDKFLEYLNLREMAS